MSSANIVFSLNQSNAADITAHLRSSDTAFQPALSSRVEIKSYSEKLQVNAVRFEAWEGQELAGLVAIYCNQVDGDKAFVSNVSVLPANQGQGLASRLMKQSIEHVRALGFTKIGLVVDANNLVAVALYSKLGFENISCHGSSLEMAVLLKKEVI